MQQDRSVSEPLFLDIPSNQNLAPVSPVQSRTRSQIPPSYHVFRYASRKHIVAPAQIFSIFLVIFTIFIGAWDCSSTNYDQKCDTLLTYHLGQDQNNYIQFGVNSLSACELASVDRSKCWKLGVSVSYASIAICGLVTGAYGVIATTLKIKGIQNQWFSFLLAVRIAHWLYLSAILTWVVFTGAILNFFKLGWCPYVLIIHSLILGYLIATHFRYWVNKLEMARLVNQLLAN